MELERIKKRLEDHKRASETVRILITNRKEAIKKLLKNASKNFGAHASRQDRAPEP